MAAERLSFFVESVERTIDGWRFKGQPGYQPQFWARPGDRFDVALNENDGDERELALIVRELADSYVVVSGSGGNLVRPGDIIVGERPAPSARTSKDGASGG